MYFSFSFIANKKIFHFTSKLVSIPTSRKYLPQKSTKRKRKHATASYALTSVNKMDNYQAEPALSRSLKNARGASVVHEIIKRKLLNYYAII